MIAYYPLVGRKAGWETPNKLAGEEMVHINGGRGFVGGEHERLAGRDMQIVLSDEARDKLAEAGFDPVYGAWPLKRAIQQQVENPLAQEILQGNFKPGDTIEVGVSDDHLEFLNAA